MKHVCEYAEVIAHHAPTRNMLLERSVANLITLDNIPTNNLIYFKLTVLIIIGINNGHPLVVA